MEVTELLKLAKDGDRSALDRAIPLLYQELKKIAAFHLRRENAVQRLQTTALVHEAYMRLAGAKQPEYENRSHFCSVASRVMRQILVDHARERCAVKRGGGSEIQIAELDMFSGQRCNILLRLDDALSSLNTSDPRMTHLIEMRFFGGMTNEECAEALEVSIHAVKREMRLAQAWLRRELEK